MKCTITQLCVDKLSAGEEFCVQRYKRSQYDRPSQARTGSGLVLGTPKAMIRPSELANINQSRSEDLTGTMYE